MEFEYKKVEPNHRDFQSLIVELNSSLNQITNDTGESSFASDSFDSLKDGCIVVYLNDSAVACGVFRYHESEVCELKRMYSSKAGAGSYLLKQLECLAIEKGYRKAILSTRRVNSKAVTFYCRQAYSESSAYGKYVGVDRSICLSKMLVI
ncbi:GNAT family N-acetyltransferase [Vibrio lentus]|uniref:GNAT family N-acetyltransferase n=1 Tax=Vibrio lentus TaxID=136468 RepID=UPI000C8157C3|nr:GNAT family N-acetyltransferase [Vibrio lentus]MCC4815016.1 GNAT family N-acetyltransferase [Vibrio lentus]PMG74666.1 GNAT family N-acetyltransferase [Vibrio lentus]PMK88601.1 GNAT family N-acetyltransferase [Vibrio lentus]PML26704.1 GNAT family N-acetyltransferase [Vibrio lentus]PMM28829.1 GNAT family N-acetyltransferase [Vibrio lentus]